MGCRYGRRDERQVELSFTVGDNGELAFFEQLPGTWTQHLERIAERELAKATPKPRPAWMEPSE